MHKAQTISGYFGVEVDPTPAQGTPTLYLIGNLSVGEINHLIDLCPVGPKHIAFGAGNSFDGIKISVWDKVIRSFLRDGFWCSLHFKPTLTPIVSGTGLGRHPRFIPVICIQAAFLDNLGGNTIIKLNDFADGKTTKGTRLIRIHDPNGGAAFVPWESYPDNIRLTKKRK